MALLQKSIASKPDLKIVVLCQKINLIEQTARRFKKVFDSVSIYCGSIDKDLSGQIVVASIQSISDVKMLVNIIVIDEVHSVDSDQGRYFEFLELNKHDKLKVLGFTATPYRADGPIYGEDKFFEKIDFIKPMDELIEEGYLVVPRMKCPKHQINTANLRIRAGEYASEDVEREVLNQELVTEQVRDALVRAEGRQKVVWACASIAHCEMVRATIEVQDLHAVMIHSKMSQDERLLSIESFERRDARHLVFVTIVSEGYDYPPIDCVVLMRPTRSPVLYVQTVGRGLRTSQGKTDCLVLDYGQVVKSCGPLNDPNVGQSRRGGKTDVQHKVCPNCQEYIDKFEAACPVCQYQFVSERKDPKLTREAEENSDIISTPKPRELEVRGIEIAYHLAKSGNECLKIVYKSANFLQRDIQEFFVWNNNFAHKRMIGRLIDMNVKLQPDLHQQVIEKAHKIPKTITVITKNGYETVMRLNFL